MCKFLKKKITYIFLKKIKQNNLKKKKMIKKISSKNIIQKNQKHQKILHTQFGEVIYSLRLGFYSLCTILLLPNTQMTLF